MSIITNTVALIQLLSDARRSSANPQETANKRLKKTLVAAAKVPRHHAIMQKSGYDPQRDFRGLSDLAIMPVMNKSDIQNRRDDFLQAGASDRVEQYFSDRTSGSTGMPLVVYRSNRERDIQIAKWMRVLLLSGYRPNDVVLSFTSPGRLSEGRSLLQNFGLLRRKTVDYTLSPEMLANEVLHYRPDVLYGVRTSFLVLADEFERRGIQPPPLKLLVAGGEVIDAHTRQRCRSIFGVDITETYGTVEMGVMAYQQAGQAGLTLIEDCTFFEFLDEAGNPAKPGELARVVVTDLHGRLMPFIRYDQGDLAVYSLRQNADGETVRVIDQIVGRRDDIVKLPDGRFLTYLDFYELADDYLGLQQIRVTQRAPLSFLIELVTDDNYLRQIREELTQRLIRLSESPLEFELRRVEAITPDASGKRRMLIAMGDGRKWHN
ncbi:Phenylacetate-coenzyme A ligase [Thiorhodovibrio winogradskyi]|uniref:Phenylacetate-coenzyme A ligase n=1 Tax=Thiorhodovibrio winogradskyi TaxID=77007 RepID=A0ABZ0SC77_9GAMM|nr:AMP-binding protein [Thiorhodovibrio winogradskyi]